jgi:hypothetical protein
MAYDYMHFAYGINTVTPHLNFNLRPIVNIHFIIIGLALREILKVGLFYICNM